MRTRSVCIPLACAASLIAGAQPTRAQFGNTGSGADNFVLTEQHAVLVDSPELVAPGMVMKAAWSPDGRYVLASRGKVDAASLVAGRPSFEMSLVLWNAAGRQRRELWKASDGSHLEWWNWLAGADVAYAMLSREAAPGQNPAPAQKWLLRVDPARGIARPLMQVAADARLDPSPTRPQALLTGGPDFMAGLLLADGTLKDLSRLLPREARGSLQWSSDGRRLAYFVQEPATGGKPPVLRWYLLDPTTGTIEGPTDRPRGGAAPKEEPRPFRLRGSRVLVREGDATREVRPLWLESTVKSEQSTMLVSADSPEGFLSPRNDAVLYVSEGAAWVRSFVRMDRAVFVAARAAAERARLMSNLKQVALGAMMYSQDYDGVLPPAGADIPGLLNPYLKSESLFAGFVYVFPGGKLSDVKEPAKTLLGYVPAPGGRVNAWVDGHVTFESEGK